MIEKPSKISSLLLVTTFCAFIMFAVVCEANPPSQDKSPVDIKKQEPDKGTCFFISPVGCDENPGTKDKPFATLEAARDAVRKLKKSEAYLANGINIYLRGGIYERQKTFELGPDDSGTAKAPVVYQSYPGETAQLVGGKIISASGFKPANRAFVDRLAEESAKRHVLELDLKVQGLADYGSLKEQHVVDFGSSTAYMPAPMELFIDGQAMTLARWPNLDPVRPPHSFIQTGRMLFTEDAQKKQKLCQGIQFKGVKSLNEDGDDVGIDPLLASDRLNRWKSLDEIPDGYMAGGLMRGYAHTTRRIASIDTEKGIVSFATPVPFYAGYKHETISNFYFRNIPQEIDQPGEYYIDRQKGMLYLYPPSAFSPKSQVAVSLMEDVLVAVEGASHTRLEGLILECTRTTAVFIAGGEDNVVAGCTIRNTGLLGVQIGMGYDAKSRKLLPRLPGSLRHALCTGMEQLAVTDLQTWGHPRGGTALDVQGGRANGVTGCRIYDTGAGGVILGGGDRKTLTPAGNFVQDSELFRTDRLTMFYAEAVLVHGVGNRVTGNYLHDSQGGILYIHGNDHIVEFNEITRAIQTSRDCGAVEIRQNPSQLGNRIVHNYFHDIGRPGFNPPINCIYLDNNASGVEISGNVFARIHIRTVAPFRKLVISANGGHTHVVANNLFLDTSGALLEDGQELAEARRNFTARRFMLESDVDVTKEPYCSRYPEFAKLYQGVMAGDESTKLFNRAYNNVLLGNGTNLGPSRYPQENYRHDNLVIQPGENIGFVDEAAGDYTLRPDSMVLSRLPDFKPIPFDKMRQAQKWKTQAAKAP